MPLASVPVQQRKVDVRIHVEDACRLLHSNGRWILHLLNLEHSIPEGIFQLTSADRHRMTTDDDDAEEFLNSLCRNRRSLWLPWRQPPKVRDSQSAVAASRMDSVRNIASSFQKGKHTRMEDTNTEVRGSIEEAEGPRVDTSLKAEASIASPLETPSHNIHSLLQMSMWLQVRSIESAMDAAKTEGNKSSTWILYHKSKIIFYFLKNFFFQSRILNVTIFPSVSSLEFPINFALKYFHEEKLICSYYK